MGAALNVGIAWAAVNWMNAIFQNAEPNVPNQTRRALRWLDDDIDYPGEEPTVQLLVTNSVVAIEGLAWPSERKSWQITPPVRVLATSAGWPMKSFIGLRQRDVGGQMTVTGAINVGAYGNVTWLQRDLPLIPLWPGFVLNTLLYAGVIFVLAAIPLWIRSHRRVKRGLCVACGYPISRSAICTECGAELPRVACMQNSHIRR